MKIKLFVYFLLVVFVAACSNPFFPPLKPKGLTLSVPITETGVDIGSIIVGETPDPFEVTITNNGKNPTGDITITISGDDADKFTIVPDTLDSIDPGDSDSFKIIPDDGLPEGEYKATVTIDCEDGTKIEFDIIFVVESLLSFIIKEIAASMVTINVPVGVAFIMGKDLGGVGSDVTPTFNVTFSKGFSISKYQVTQQQYEAVMGTNPSYFHGGTGREPATDEVQERRPVEQVSWYDAIVFCNKLSVLAGLTPA